MSSSTGGGIPSMLVPHGPAAERIAELWWVLAAVAVLVYAIVLGLLVVALVRRRRPPAAGDAAAAERRATLAVVVGGGVLPALIISGLFVASVRTLGAVVLPSREPALTIDVVGHQWWWEVQYPGPAADHVVRSANELHIPIGRPVRLRLISRDVIHSFWVPQLQGKLDLIPGKINETWIQADTAGVYRGQCAEYCGLQHARMAFVVVAMAPEAFDAWLARERQPAVVPTDPVARQGEAVFMRSCASCHTVRGTAAFFGRQGPDLTHLASRHTLAAGLLPNVRGARAGWIANPQALKPGNKMPHVRLTAEEFHAVLEFLEALR